MGLCKTSNFSIFTFISGSDLKFCTRSYSSWVYRMIGCKGSNEKACKMMTSQNSIGKKMENRFGVGHNAAFA